ncbi:MAG: RodZ domain-containing protein [candidate division FCPU426 bacterium]
MTEATQVTENEKTSTEEKTLTIGEQLRAQRKARGISLVEVAEHTKIGKRYLEAFEEDRFDVLPCEAYIRGFLRAYAKYLEIDDERILSQYKILQHAQCTEPPTSGHSNGGRKSNQNVWVPLVAILLVTGLGAGLFLLWPAGQEETANPPAVSGELNAPAAALPKAPGPDDPLTLKIKGKDKTWITLMIDGRQEPDITLNPNEERTWQAQERFVLWTGNAGGIEIYFNGELQPPLGETGEVRKEVIFERRQPVIETERVPAPATP